MNWYLQQFSSVGPRIYFLSVNGFQKFYSVPETASDRQKLKMRFRGRHCEFQEGKRVAGLFFFFSIFQSVCLYCHKATWTEYGQLFIPSADLLGLMQISGNSFILCALTIALLGIPNHSCDICYFRNIICHWYLQ